MIFLNNLWFCFNILKKCTVVFIKKTVEKEQFDRFEFLKQEACLDYFPLSNVVIFCNCMMLHICEHYHIKRFNFDLEIYIDKKLINEIVEIDDKFTKQPIIWL